MEEIVVKPKARRQTGYLLLAAAGTALCSLTTVLDMPFRWQNLLITLVFAGCFVFFYLEGSSSGKASATVGDGGVTVRMGKLPQTVRWEEIRNPRIIRAVGRREFLSFDVEDTAAFLARLPEARQKIVERNRSMGYGFFNIPTDRSDISAAALYSIFLEKLQSLNRPVAESPEAGKFI